MPDTNETALWSTEAEQGVLGSILLDSARVMSLMTREGIAPDWFHFERHRLLYSVFLALHAEGSPCDLITAVTKLRAAKKLSAVGGVALLEAVVDATPTSAHAEHYLSIVREKKLMRDLMDLSNKLRAELLESNQDSAELIRARYESLLSKLVQASAAKRTLAEIARTKVSEWEIINSSGQVSGLRTGMAWLDSQIGGMLPGCLLVISGPPGSAKTTLGRQIVENCCKMGGPCAVVTSEQSSEEYTGGMIAAEAGIPVSVLNVPGCSAYGIAAVQAAEKQVAAWPLKVEDLPMTRTQLVSHFSREIAQGTRLFLYDFLQDAVACNADEERSDEKRVTAVSKALRLLARRTKTCAIAVSNENYHGEMRYSRQIESDAWVWLKITKHDQYDKDAYPAYKVACKKARFAPGGFEMVLLWRAGRLVPEADWTASKLKSAGSGRMAGT